MPIRQDAATKYYGIGKGPAVYKQLEAVRRAYAAYRAKKWSEKEEQEEEVEESAEQQKFAEEVELPLRDRVEVVPLLNGKLYSGLYDNDRTLALPGGGVDPGETIEEAAARELLEETGLTALAIRKSDEAPLVTQWNMSPQAVAARAKDRQHFSGSRTHWVFADVGPDMKDPPDFWEADNRMFRTPEEAVKLCAEPGTRKPIHDIRRRVLESLLTHKTAASKALGLPDPHDYGSPSELPVGSLVPWVVQEHDALRAGKHYDIRLGKDRMLSWSSRKGMPGPADPRLVKEQPVHAQPYMDFEGILPTGYGAGTVRTSDKGKVLITKADADHIQAVVAHKKRPVRLNFLRGKDGRWLLTDSTPQKPIMDLKGKYKQISEAALDELLNNQENLVTPKIDGAAGVYDLSPKKVEAYSIRTGVDGLPIVHTERLGLAGLRAAVKARLRGEIFATDKSGKAIPPQELGGLLNSTLENSLTEQQRRQLQPANYLFNISEYAGKPVPADTPYEKKLELIRKAIKGLPKDKFIVPEPVSGDAARALVKEILAGKNPLTDEGVVVAAPGGEMLKMKRRPEYDVLAREVYAGSRPGLYGGFRYSLKPGSDIVGNVGTGLSGDTRRRLADYVGRWAKIKAQGQFPSGAYRAPSLISFHEDK